MTNDIHDTMNMLAEADDDHNMDVIADMAPPPPPEPPPCRLECSSCGYIAPEPEFHKNHPYCKVGIGMWIAFGAIVIILTAMPLIAMYNALINN